jgi:hypothetical protein
LKNIFRRCPLNAHVSIFFLQTATEEKIPETRQLQLRKCKQKKQLTNRNKTAAAAAVEQLIEEKCASHCETSELVLQQQQPQEQLDNNSVTVLQFGPPTLQLDTEGNLCWQSTNFTPFDAGSGISLNEVSPQCWGGSIIGLSDQHTVAKNQ